MRFLKKFKGFDRTHLPKWLRRFPDGELVLRQRSKSSPRVPDKPKFKYWRMLNLDEERALANIGAEVTRELADSVTYYWESRRAEDIEEVFTLSRV